MKRETKVVMAAEELNKQTRSRPTTANSGWVNDMELAGWRRPTEKSI